MNKLLAPALLFICFCNTVIARNDVKTPELSKSSYFIENNGQITDQFYQPRTDIDFKLEATGGLNVFIGAEAIHYQFCRPDSTSVVRLKTKLPIDRLEATGHEMPETVDYVMYRMDVELIGANKNVALIKEGKQGYYENYYTPGVGIDGATAYTYEKITYKNVYPGIDWVVYTPPAPLKGSDNIRGIKYDFIVHPGGDASLIKLKYSGATSIALNEDGSLTATTPQGVITEHAPISYQEDGMPVASKFVLNGDVLSFEVGEYHGRLVIDPGLDWATYYGGYFGEAVRRICVNDSGHIYMSGGTMSASKIATIGAFQVTYADSADAFLAKFSSTGTLLWSTYYGNTGLEEGGCLSAVDKFDNVYIAGLTFSRTGLSTPGAHQEENPGGSLWGYLAKFNSMGFRKWATYYGETGGEVYLLSLATDRMGNVYIGGNTNSSTGIATNGSHQQNKASTYDGFFAKFDSLGVRMWGTYYGGSASERISGMVTNDSGFLYIVGQTYSANGIATSGSYMPAKNGLGHDVFIAKFDTAGVQVWGTYYGGTANDQGFNIAVDSSGEVYITGVTWSVNGIATLGAGPTSTISLYGAAFLTKFSATGQLRWGRYYDGPDYEIGFGVATDMNGHVYITGETNSKIDIATPGAYKTTYGGGYRDIFLAMFNNSGDLLWGTYLGGDQDDRGKSVTFDTCSNIFIAGDTKSNNQSTSGAHQTLLAGNSDIYFAKLYYVPQSLDSIAGQSSICVGDTIMMTNTATGGQWQTTSGHAYVSVLGAITGVLPGNDTLVYSFTSNCGAVSKIKVITVLPLPILLQPSDAAINAGWNAVFDVSTTGSALSYQWQENSGSGFQDVNNGGQYNGATTDRLVISNTTQANHNHQFRCVVTSTGCSDTSDSATLYVWPLGIAGQTTNNGMKVYPNPVKTVLYLKAPPGHASGVMRVELYDVLGRKVLRQELTMQEMSGANNPMPTGRQAPLTPLKRGSVDVSGLAAGVYMVKINGTYISKIIKE